MTFAAVGSFVQSVTTTLALSPAKIGNFYLVEVLAESSTVYCSSVTGGNCTWVVAGSKFAGANNAGYATIFIGTATAVGSANATLAFSGATPSFEAAGQQFSSTAGHWVQDGPQGTLDLVSGTNTWPGLTPSGSGDLYFGFFSDSGTAVAGSTTGYTYDVNAGGDGLAFNPNCSAAAQAPVWNDSGQQFGAAILLRETPSGPSSHAVQVRQPQKKFNRGLLYSTPVVASFTYSAAYSTGLISASYGALVNNPLPTPGPVFFQKTSPVQARIPQNAPRGRIYGISSGAPVQNPAPGPVFRQKTSPARIRITLPPRGRVSSNHGAQVRNPTAGAVFRQRTFIRAQRPLPRRGSCRAIRGYPISLPPNPGPVFYQKTFAVSIHFILPPKGRMKWNYGAPVINPPPPPPPPPVPQALPSFNSVPGLMATGLAFPGMPVDFGTRWTYIGDIALLYLDYLNGDNKETLYVIPGGNYRILVANTRAGLTIPPSDGRWLTDEPIDEIPLYRKVFLKMRAHIGRSRRRSGYRNS